MVRSRRHTAADVMSSPVFALERGTSLQEAAAALVGRQFSGAPVIDEGGEVVGVVSMFDIVTYMAGLERPAGAPGGFYSYVYPDTNGDQEEWETDVARAEENPLRETAVKEIMTREIISVRPSEPVLHVAGLMVERHIHRVLVMKAGKLLGVVSTLDIMRDLAGLPALV